MTYRDFAVILLVAVVAAGCGLGGSKTEAPKPAQAAAAAPAPSATPVQAAPPAKPAKQGPPLRKGWDFKKQPVDQWEWAFPGGKAEQASHGALYMSDAKGDGPTWSGKAFNAGDFKRVRIQVMSTRMAEDETAEAAKKDEPEKASDKSKSKDKDKDKDKDKSKDTKAEADKAEDEKKDEAAPAKKEKPVDLPGPPVLSWGVMKDQGNGEMVFEKKGEVRTSRRTASPYVYEMNLGKRMGWDGEIGALAVDIPVGEADKEPLRVYVRSIEFLRDPMQ